jgi:hypothetical protein
MKKFVLFIALALLLPSAIAFNCNSLSGGDLQVCNSIQNTNLSQADKDLMISDIFNQNKTSPNFNFVYQWNTNLNILNSPDGRTSSSGTINGAWVKIIALMPSIIENNTLYASDTGKLQTAYNFQFGNLPSGTEYRDCATYYSWDSKTSSLSVYLNNNLIGSNKISAYQIYNSPTDLNFKAELSINARYKVNHYRYRYVNRIYKCASYSTEYRTDSLKLSDSLNAKLYKNTLNSSFKVTDEYSGITKGILEANNYTNLALSFSNSQYNYNKYIYSLNYSLPYYALTIRADPVESSNFNNIHVERKNDSFYFNVKDTSNCKIQLNDFFSSRTFPCDLNFNETNFSIKTDQINYFDNDTIKVYIFPSDIVVNLTYANQTITTKNYTEFRSVLYENKITAYLEDKEQTALVNVNRREDFDTLYQLSSLFFVGYICYRASRSYLFNLEAR